MPASGTLMSNSQVDGVARPHYTWLFVTGSVRAGNEKPMKHREENGSFHIKLELPL